MILTPCNPEYDKIVRERTLKLKKAQTEVYVLNAGRIIPERELEDGPMNKERLIKVCETWIESGFGDDCFWEGWYEEPKSETFTPKQLLAVLRGT